MSKTYSRGKNSHHGYNNNRTNDIEKRTSVFARLGLPHGRRENQPSGSTHYPASPDDYKSARNDVLKTHVHRSGHSASKRGQEGSHGKSKSRSPSPRLKKKPTAPSSSSVAHRSSKTKSSTKLSVKGDKEKQFGRKASPKRLLSNKSSNKMKATKSPRPKTTIKSSNKKVTSQMKGKGKIRSSSLSSDGSTASSSSYTSRSRSSSSASHASTSTTTAATTSTDSSVPSIKLKPAKKDKSKKKLKKKPKSTGGIGASGGEKIKHIVSSGKRQSISSSPSSKDSRLGSHYKDVKRSKSSAMMNRHKSPDNRQINSSDLKRNSQMKGVKSMDREKEQFQQQDRNFHDHMSRGKDRGLNFEDESRKRRLSDDTFGSSDGNYGSHKRSRTVPSPSPKYNKSNNRRTPSPVPRRVPPDPPSTGHKFAPRRSPPPRPPSRERIRLARSPPRRSSLDEHHRRLSPRDRGGSNVLSYDNGNKMKTLMTRDRPFGSSSQHGNANYDKTNYSPRGETNRLGDRYGVPQSSSRPNPKYAPARPSPGMERGGRIAPKQLDSERDHGLMLTKDRPQDYDSPRSGRGPPLLGASPAMVGGNKPGLLSKPQSQRIVHEEPRLRPGQGGGTPVNRHMPMIVKTKEALMERYEEQTIKQSRVDMWVDQTLKGNSCNISVESFDSDNKTSSSKPKLVDEAIRTSTPEENKDKCSSIGSFSGVTMEPITTKSDTDKATPKDVDEELSDFSDDADDILTQDIVVVATNEPDTVVTTTNSTSLPKESVEESNSTLPDVLKSSDEINLVISDTIKQVEETVSNADLDKDSARTVVSTSSLPVQSTSDLRDGRSLPSQSQTDDDILDRMDFEEISDEDFGDVENKISIVDVLGINWASLLRRDKCETTSVVTGSTVRQRWTSAKVFKHVGISREHCGPLFQKVVDKLKETLTPSPPDDDTTQKQPDEEDDDNDDEKLEKELQSPIQRLRAEERKNLFQNYGLGHHSRAFSARRDMVVRRYLLNLPAKSLMSVDFGNQVSNSQDVDCTELLKLSVSLFKRL